MDEREQRIIENRLKKEQHLREGLAEMVKELEERIELEQQRLRVFKAYLNGEDLGKAHGNL